MAYGLAQRVLFEAVANRGQVILGHRLIVHGSRLEEKPEGIRWLLTEVLQEPPRWPELRFRQLFDRVCSAWRSSMSPFYSTLAGVATPTRRQPAARDGPSWPDR